MGSYASYCVGLFAPMRTEWFLSDMAKATELSLSLRMAV